MKDQSHKSILATFALALTFILQLSTAFAQGTAFTYQGRLYDGTNAANGTYDFTFSIFDAASGGAQQGGSYSRPATGVTNGLFTVTLDFGNVFPGARRWLEIGVRTNTLVTGSPFTTLAPRQELTPTPYAIFAENAGNVSGAAATSTNIPNTIVKRDATGSFAAQNLTLDGALTLTADPARFYQGSDLLLYSDGSIGGNTALGFDALEASPSGTWNTAIGHSALFGAMGNNNTAVGYQALESVAGHDNIALGEGAGFLLYVGTCSYNIDIGNPGEYYDSHVIRIGNGSYQTNTYIAGIYNATVAGGVPVYVNGNGQLGVLSSSKKFKQDIQPMGGASDALLALQPVTFKYKSTIDPAGTPQFGLIAEQVEKVDPALVVHDSEHGIYTVRYQAVDAMLLNEFLKEHQTVRQQEAAMRTAQNQIQYQTLEIDDLKSRLAKLEQLLTQESKPGN
jgi:Chaperone of endosialidase